MLADPVRGFTPDAKFDPEGFKNMLALRADHRHGHRRVTIERAVDPGRLVDFKLQANDWEEQYSSLARHSCVRPLNLDPGYVTPAKLVLASTKDYAHRIYLGRGIYAEITLFYRQRAWQAHEWTFPDYRRADYHDFLNRCREYLRRQSPGHAIGDSG
jgi:hypothetical protein